MSQIIEKYGILTELRLNKDFIKNIKLLYVFEDSNFDKSVVFIVTNDDKTYAFGGNSYGVLGFGHENEVNELIVNEDLSNKQIVDFRNSERHVIARTIDGKVYCWGSNECGSLGNGKANDKIYKPRLNLYLSDKHIIDVCCGENHSLVLTNDGQVYAWGNNWKGQIGNGRYGKVSTPYHIKGFNEEKVKAIACGFWHSMALTESGNVFSWGYNDCGQLGFKKLTDDESINIPKLIEISVIFDRITCGQYHSLLLSRDGDIYAFGSNEFGQLGDEEVDNQCELPLKLENENRFIDIVSHYEENISMALSQNKIIFIWGKYRYQLINPPFQTQFKSFDEVFAHYFQTTYRAVVIAEKLGENTGNGKYSEEFIESEMIGHGNCGIVCKAMNRKDNEFYAVKKIPINGMIQEKVAKEIETLPKLRSNEYTVKLESVWIEENYIKSNEYKKFEDLISTHIMFRPDNTFLLHIQMELCSFNLKDAINKLNTELNQKLSQTMTSLGYCIASELFIEILESVGYLHKQDIIHGNLKSTNILITNGMNGRFIKLADFELAVIREFVSQSHTKSLGTHDYIVSEATKYDIKSDVYSLGLIIQELFNIDINKPIEKNSDLKERYSNLFDLTKRMTLTQRNQRPNCEQILNEKNLWALGLDELKDKKKFESKRMKYSEEMFHLSFIRMKSSRS